MNDDKEENINRYPVTWYRGTTIGALNPTSGLAASKIAFSGFFALLIAAAANNASKDDELQSYMESMMKIMLRHYAKVADSGMFDVEMADEEIVRYTMAAVFACTGQAIHRASLAMEIPKIICALSREDYPDISRSFINPIRSMLRDLINETSLKGDADELMSDGEMPTSIITLAGSLPLSATRGYITSYDYMGLGIASISIDDIVKNMFDGHESPDEVNNAILSVVISTYVGGLLSEEVGAGGEIEEHISAEIDAYVRGDPEKQELSEYISEKATMTAAIANAVARFVAEAINQFTAGEEE